MQRRTSPPTPLASAPERLVGVAVTVEDEAGGSAIIEATEEHPIWVGDTDNGGGYVEVQDLAVGDVLRTDDGRTAWVSDLQFRSGTVDVFNSEVAGLHNYFVEELAGVGVLVHNAPGCFDEAVAAAQDAVASKGGTLGASKRGTSGGPRAGKRFTRKGKAEIDAENASRNGGANVCENCGVETVPGKRSEKGVTPPGNERQRDHIDLKSKGGDGDPANGQILCRDCNLDKSDKTP